ncbi:tetratricopeptide repeat protein [bacterium]|nr:tetratricopeptide repeat protein [bacterium]MBU1880401.1 tetratricopeptide repeat protein [bacterium]
MKIKWILPLIAVAAIISVAVSLRSDRLYTTSSDQAYNYFIAGKEAAERLYNSEALENFEAAVQIDSSFASAWAYLSKYYYTMGRSEEGKMAAKQAYKLSQDLPERERLNVQLLTAEFRGDSDQFEALLELMLERYPGEVEPHLYKANQHWQRGELQEAIAEFNIILKLNPNHALSYNSLGYLHAQMGDFENAIKYLKKYVFIAPDQANPHDSLGEIYIMVGRYQDAIDHFRRALAVKPNLGTEPNNLGSVIFVHLAKAQRSQGKLHEAKKSLGRASELSIGGWYDQQILVEEAKLLKCQEQYEAAIDLISQAKLLYGKYDSDLRVSLASLYCELNQREKIDELISENEEDIRKTIYKMAQDTIDITDEVLAKYATECETCNKLSLIKKSLQVYKLRQIHEYEPALTILDDLLDDVVMFESKMDIWYVMAKIHFDKGNFQKSIDLADHLMQYNPQHPNLQILKAKAEEAAGMHDEAVRTLEQFLASSYDADENWMPRTEAKALLKSIREEQILSLH